MNNTRQGFFTAKNIAVMGILLAFVLILQMGLGAIVIGSTSFSLVLVPIVLGSILLGPLAGGILGFVFSFIVFIYGVVGADVFTHVMIECNWFVTFLICFSKGIMAGVVPGLIYKAFTRNKTFSETTSTADTTFDTEKDTGNRIFQTKKELLGVIVASLSAPVVNTGLFVLLMILFRSVFVDAFVSQGFFESASKFFYFIIIVCAGVNFLVEFAVNAILIPVVNVVVRVVGKSVKRG